MLDTRVESIIYQSQIYYRDKINELVDYRKLGKAYEHEWDRVDEIGAYLDALNYRDRLTDDEDVLDVNHILECLIKLCELNIFPIAAPIAFQEPPDVLVGIPGAPGTSVTGPRGETGLATDIQVSNVTSTAVIDSFPVGNAKGARWDYVVTSTTGNQRGGTVIGQWSSDGANIDFFDNATGDIVGSTAGIEFEVQYSSGNIQLVAVVTSGNWTIVATRYYIPNNGNGSGPISASLADGKIYIGNASNVATAQTVSGAFTITNTGVATLSAGIIVDSNINASAAITLTKLAALTAGRAIVSNGSGFLAVSAVTTTELGYVSGVTSAIQTQINTKLTDPMTTIGDMIYRNGSNVTARLPIGSDGEVLTMVGGLPTWDAPSAGLLETILDIGDWNMASTSSVTIPLPVDRTKIRAVHVEIRSDDLGGGEYWTVPLNSGTGLSSGGHTINPNGLSTPADEIALTRASGGMFSFSAYDQTSWNRGWITIKHVP